MLAIAVAIVLAAAVQAYFLHRIRRAIHDEFRTHAIRSERNAGCVSVAIKSIEDTLRRESSRDRLLAERNAPMRELRAQYLSQTACIDTQGRDALEFLRVMSDALGVGVDFEQLAASAKKRLSVDARATKRLLEMCIGVGAITQWRGGDLTERFQVTADGMETICAVVVA